MRASLRVCSQDRSSGDINSSISTSCKLYSKILHAYIEASDSIVLRAAEVPEGDPTTDESAANGVPDPGETPVTDVIVM